MTCEKEIGEEVAEGEPQAALRAPFPYFGGKAPIAAEIWSRIGDVVNYIEPFFGSGAVLFSRPKVGRIETVNDKDRFIANFWRATQHDPEAVAHWLDWPVNECDLTARHLWLINEGAARIARCDGEPDFFDAQVAGWWCWGACSWIGSGWCSGTGPWVWDNKEHEWGKRPHPSDARPGINRQRPHLSSAGQGIKRKLPHLGDAGRGINCKRPHLWKGHGINRVKFAGKSDALLSWIQALAGRLRNVRVCCGDWSRVCGLSVTYGHGLTGVFLDPPYSDAANRSKNVYSTDDLTVAHVARKWAIEEGSNPLMRIAFAGYDGEHTFPYNWTEWSWKTQGGFGNQGNTSGRDNSHRERIWFSPHCAAQRQGRLFE
jgi:hypothetical protein